MSNPIPEFHSEHEMVEWFEQSDLSMYDLQEALEVVVATKLGLAVADPWTQATSASAATAGAAALVEFVSA